MYDLSRATANEDSLCFLHSSTFRPTLNPSAQAEPAPPLDKFLLQLPLASVALILIDLPAVVEALFFNSLMTVLVLICKTRAVSRIPLPFSAMSTICSLTFLD